MPSSSARDEATLPLFRRGDANMLRRRPVKLPLDLKGLVTYVEHGALSIFTERFLPSPDVLQQNERVLEGPKRRRLPRFVHGLGGAAG